MFIYVFTNYKSKIMREEVEVIEKNTYYEKISSGTKTRFKKEDLDVLQRYGSGGSVSMISLCGRVDKFVAKVIEYKKGRAGLYHQKMIAEKNEIIDIQHKFGGLLNNNIENDEYLSCGHIEFEAEGERMKGKISVNAVTRFKIQKLYSAEEFLEKFNSGEFSKEETVLNIFVDGKNTNIFLEDFKKPEECSNGMSISIDKLKEIQNKAKVEINIQA